MVRQYLENPSVARRSDEPARWFVNNEAELLDLVAVFDDGTPRVIWLITPTCDYLFGVGCALSRLSFVSCFHPLTGKSFSVRPKRDALGGQSIRFASGPHSAIEVRAEWLMPADDAMKIVTCLFRQGELPEGLEWRPSPWT